MKIFYYRGEYPNFGDELNTWLWPRLFPGMFDEDAETLFLGIGSTIGDAATHVGKKILFGAGFVEQYHAKPVVAPPQWEVYFVRGPRTATALNLAPEVAITDAGVLARTVLPRAGGGKTIGFMPHWQSLAGGHWQAACAQAGVTLIDPRAPVETVLAQLADSRLVIAEAMHGAIMADALRVPWLPVVPLNPAHRGKWADWAESLALELRWQRLLPSSLGEVSAAAFHTRPSAAQNQSHTSANASPSTLSRIKSRVAASPLAPWVDARITEWAARRLATLSCMEGMLSEDAVIDRATERMLEQCEAFRRNNHIR